MPLLLDTLSRSQLFHLLKSSAILFDMHECEQDGQLIDQV